MENKTYTAKGRIEDSLRKKMNRAMKVLDRTESWMVRAALTEFLEKHNYTKSKKK